MTTLRTLMQISSIFECYFTWRVHTRLMLPLPQSTYTRGLTPRAPDEDKSTPERHITANLCAWALVYANNAALLAPCCVDSCIGCPSLWRCHRVRCVVLVSIYAPDAVLGVVSCPTSFVIWFL